MDAINIRNLTKHYGKARGIEQVNLTVAQGEFFGFIGPNGAGKSTTIRTLLGLIGPTSGSAAVCGLDIVKDKDKILAQTGYLPSEAMFYAGMRVRDVLKLSADLRRKDCRETALPAAAAGYGAESGGAFLRQPEEGRHCLRLAA